MSWSRHAPQNFLIGALALSGCQNCATYEEPAAAPSLSEAVVPPQLQPGQPALVVAVVFDQLGADTLERLLPRLDPEGALRTGVEQGAFFPRVRYPHAVTLTAPGHALLFTGATPSLTGITGNVLARGGGRLSSSVDDGGHAVHGVPGLNAGPGLLLAETVGDAHKQARPGQGAQVIALSLKDRAAVLSGGQQADLSLWYEAGLPGFTTSTYYERERPSFVTAFEAEHPLSELSVPWNVSAAPEVLHELGPDDAEGESHIQGFGERFPHNAGTTPHPASALRLTPALSEYLISLSEVAVRHRHLGEDDAPDLLVLSISGTDYAGHAFGPDSWEYFEHLRRADAALGAMLRRLASDIRLSVVISSDHGVARLPERDQHGRRLPSVDLAGSVEAKLDLDLGANDWVLAFSAPYLYLTEAAKNHPRAAEARHLACEALVAVAEVHAVYDAQGGEGPVPCKAPEGAAGNALLAEVANSVYRARSGDFYVVSTENTIVDESSAANAGTTHGSPWDYDRDVFVVAYGAGVERGRHEGDFDTRSYASTLAALLGSPSPNHAQAKALPGITSFKPAPDPG